MAVTDLTELEQRKLQKLMIINITAHNKTHAEGEPVTLCVTWGAKKKLERDFLEGHVVTGQEVM